MPATSISQIVAANTQGNGRTFSVRSIDLEAFGPLASPLAVLDDFRVSGRPFGPHPHAGFSTVTYVFEDSQAAVRSRDSLGNDLRVGPGGIVWTQAASGIVHEETPADDGRELHGLQVFVNLSARNKLRSPGVMRLLPQDVPERRTAAGDRVRVLTGTFDGVTSPLTPAEPFDAFDVELRGSLSFPLAHGRNAVLYVREGVVRARAGDATRAVQAGAAVAFGGAGETVTLEALAPSRGVILSGTALTDPVVSDGPFIMNDRSQIAAAIARYRAGTMGELTPLSKG